MAFKCHNLAFKMPTFSVMKLTPGNFGAIYKMSKKLLTPIRGSLLVRRAEKVPKNSGIKNMATELWTTDIY